MTAGAEKTEDPRSVFLFSDTQIVEESLLEDINNILNSGEVPNLFANDEWEKICGDMIPARQGPRHPRDQATTSSTFVSRVRENLHIVLACRPSALPSACAAACSRRSSTAARSTGMTAGPSRRCIAVAKQFLAARVLPEDREAAPRSSTLTRAR